MLRRWGFGSVERDRSDGEIEKKTKKTKKEEERAVLMGELSNREEFYKAVPTD